MPDADAVLRIDGLVKHYGRVEAVRGLDLEVRTGEVVGFLGPNGAGKTTTLRCLLGLLRPTAGRITVFGLDVATDGVAARRRMAYVPGELRLPERVTGSELVASLGRLRGSLDPARRDALAERLQLDLGRRVRELSTGNRRKVALLTAFLSGADLLVLDEPTSGLDPLMQHVFLELVREARAAGATILLSSHVLSEVQRAADRVVVLKSGAVVAAGTVTELRGRARQRLEIWFAGPAPAAELLDLPQLGQPVVDGSHVTATLTGPIQPLLGVLARHQVATLLVEEPDLEEAFLDLYGSAA
ncbi:MAG TPA: ABC transporter ATP-binding protein [Candidatus Sulfotelmatobacter sp.]|nr:ABC transporter ATP-binding protein [Candidatus Sulfotelmatobacter sp.]